MKFAKLQEVSDGILGTAKKEWTVKISTTLRVAFYTYKSAHMQEHKLAKINLNNM